MEFPNNTEKAKLEQNAQLPEEKRPEKSPIANARHRPTFFKMVRDCWIPKDVDNAGQYILSEMVMPGIRDGVFNIIYGIIDYWQAGVGGKSGRSRNNFTSASKPTRISQTDYNRPSRIGQNYDRQPALVTSSYDDIFIPDDENEKGSVKAERILACLRDDLRKYHKVSIADYCEYCGITSVPSDHYYGWVNLDRAGQRWSPGGAIIIMPATIQFDDI